MTDPQPDVDVVILSWNRREDTLEAIRSARSQVGVRVHVLVVDQGSDADCVAAMREAQARGEIELKELGKNEGPGPGRNAAMELGSSPYIAGIDNDAVFEDVHALRRAVEKFQANKDLGAIAFRIKSYSTGFDDPYRWPYPRGLRNHRDKQFWTTRYVGCGHALRREALRKTRGYDRCLIFNWEELDLSYQVIDAGYVIQYEPAIVVLHKLSPEKRFRWEKTRWYYYVRNALYLDYKFYRKWARLLPMALGYLAKGTWNGLPQVTLRAVRDGLQMSKQIDPTFHPLGPAAVAYIDRYDRLPRGSVLRRIKEEIFEILPPQESPTQQ